MHILVVGAGAMGGLFGARLASAGNDVLLYDTWTAHVEAIQRDGLYIEEMDGTPVRYKVAATDTLPASAALAELVLVQVKSYDTYAAMAPLAGRLDEEARVLSLQNGLGNLEQLRRALPNHQHILLGTTAHGASVLAPGKIRHAGRGANVIGDPRDSVPEARPDLTAIHDTFEAAGFQTEVAADVMAAVWKKLMVNVALNPVAALAGVRTGEILRDPDLLMLSEVAVREALEVMRAEGIHAREDYLGYARHVMELTADNVASMVQDIRAGRRTEIDAINGAIARLADEHRLRAPVNRWLAALVRHREKDAARTLAAAMKETNPA